MKPLKLILTLVAILCIAPQVLAQRVFSEYPAQKDITSVYISKTAMKLGLSSMNDSSVSGIIESITNPGGMEVITANSPKAVALVKADCEKVLKTLNLEVLLDVKNDDAESTCIYTAGVEGDVAHDILIVNGSENEINIVYIKGNINVKSVMGDK